MGGAPKFDESQALPEVSYADVARTMGLKAIAVDDPEAVGAALDHALATAEPIVLDMRTDPEVPPIPPHTTYDEMKSMTEALLKGDPNGWHVVGEIAKNKAAELFTRAGLSPKRGG
jgi:pyruvate dehydrogenase (quinone)